MENNEIKKSKYLKIYTRSLANFLMDKGYFATETEINKKNPRRLVWIYERTPEVLKLFEEYINKSKTSAKAEVLNK